MEISVERLSSIDKPGNGLPFGTPTSFPPPTCTPAQPSRTLLTLKRLKRMVNRATHMLTEPLPDLAWDRLRFFTKLGYFPNLRHPRCFNEKVCYRKSAHAEHPRYRQLADKYAVREHVTSLIGDKYLIPLLHETTEPTSLLKLNSWRSKVIKASHGSGMTELIFDEPDNNQKKKILRSCEEWLKTDFSLVAREMHYRGIPPRILVEQYIGNGQTAPEDYKFHMFRQTDGSFQYVLQVIYRSQHKATSAFFVNNLFAHYPTSGCDYRPIPCAQHFLQKALELSKVLAANFDYVRVDWYIHQNSIYFGELTFTPCAGFVTGLDNGLNLLMGLMWTQQHTPTPTPTKKYIHPILFPR